MRIVVNNVDSGDCKRCIKNKVRKIDVIQIIYVPRIGFNSHISVS
jgi:hypothetical protein